MRRTFATPLWIAAGLLLPVALLAQAPAGATAKCKDGSYSTATSSKGRCSAHGGVANLISTRKRSSRSTASTERTPAKTTATPAAPRSSRSTSTKSTKHKTTSAPATAPAPAPSPSPSGSEAPAAIPTVRAPAGAPAGATALCKDGTYSTSKVHTGACSHHGGVGQWLQ